VLRAWTSRQSCGGDLVPDGLGLGEGLEPVGLGEGEPEGLALGLVLGLVLGLDEALLVALGVAVALLLAVGVLLAFAVLLGVALLVAFAVALEVGVALAVAVAVEEALALADGEEELLDLVALGFGDADAGSETASRMTAGWPAGTVRAADLVAGGWPQTLGALTALAFAAFTVLASAAVPPPRSPPMMLDETRAAPATRPNAEVADRADLMAAPSSPWSSSSRPRVSFD
jgi:hypothetical protein